jgi:hypothetical protein
MSKGPRISEEDETAMDRFGITCSSKMVFFYKKYRYENLADALRYAKSDYAGMRDQKNAGPLA